VQVLLSTTIVESGIDIGQANTIIINNAHLFGLSQLYQLRGRVGRSSSQAFAWFLFPLKKNTGDAKKRIESIIKNTSLGAGYDIALSDLEIRGSGSLFGYKQSGRGGVGFEYYSKLLSLASQPQNQNACVVNIFNTSLDKHITNEGQRGFFYKSILSAGTKKELLQIKKDFLSFFGSTPKPLLLLLKTQKLALLAASKRIIKISKKDGFIILTFAEKQPSGFLDFIIPFISSFFITKKVPFNFLVNKKNFTFQYKSIEENDYILLVSFFNKISF
jgi:transcription-repair coupling factor (superfamily II helicase)